MKKTEKELKDIVIKVSQDIMGLTTVYGPLDVDDLVQKVYEYFPDDFNEIDTDDIYQIVYSLEKEKMLNINEREEASFFTEKGLYQIYSAVLRNQPESVPFVHSFKIGKFLKDIRGNNHLYISSLQKLTHFGRYLRSNKGLLTVESSEYSLKQRLYIYSLEIFHCHICGPEQTCGQDNQKQ